MKNTTRIALVEYLNTKPFQWAMEKDSIKKLTNVQLVPPAECARLLRDKEVDLALIPIGAIHEIENPEILLDYGIACDGNVRTVVIMSNCPIEEIKFLHLDGHSRTSQKLAVILLKEMGITDLNYNKVEVDENLYLQKNEAVLLIGDKVFRYEKKYKYSYDLGELWKEKTGLPFVFAVWVQSKNNPVSPSLIKLLSHAFMQEINDLRSSLSAKLEREGLNPEEFLGYYRRNIDYRLGKDKKMAMTMFLQKINKYNLNHL